MISAKLSIEVPVKVESMIKVIVSVIIAHGANEPKSKITFESVAESSGADELTYVNHAGI